MIIIIMIIILIIIMIIIIIIGRPPRGHQAVEGVCSLFVCVL